MYKTPQYYQKLSESYKCGYGNNLYTILRIYIFIYICIYIFLLADHTYTHKKASLCCVHTCTQIAKFMGRTWGPPGSCRPQMGPILAPWTLLSGWTGHATWECQDVIHMGWFQLPPRCLVICMFAYFDHVHGAIFSLIESFLGLTWDPPGADRTQVGPMLAHESCYLACLQDQLLHSIDLVCYTSYHQQLKAHVLGSY